MRTRSRIRRRWNGSTRPTRPGAGSRNTTPTRSRSTTATSTVRSDSSMTTQAVARCGSIRPTVARALTRRDGRTASSLRKRTTVCWRPNNQRLVKLPLTWQTPDESPQCWVVKVILLDPVTNPSVAFGTIEILNCNCPPSEQLPHCGSHTVAVLEYIIVKVDPS